MAKLLIALLLITNLYAGKVELDNFASKFTSDKKLKEEVYNASLIAERLYKIDQKLIYSLIATESSFKNVGNSKGSIGLCQVQLPTAQYLYKKYKMQSMLSYPKSDKDLYNVYTNILVSACYLRYLQDSLDLNLYNTLRAYNAGPSGYKKVNNKKYADKVLNYKMTIRRSNQL